MERERLVCVALADVPVEIRRRAAKQIRAGFRQLDGVTPEALLLAAVFDDGIDQAVEQPSGSYWLSERAVRAVLG